MLPIRFDSDGFEVRVRDRWYALPFVVTASIITAASVGLYWALVRGPTWASLVAWSIIILPSAALVAALVWTGAQAHSGWFIARWYRLPLGFALALALIALEAVNLRWPDGEQLNGYVWGGLVAVFCSLTWIFAYRQRRTAKKVNR